MGCEATDLRLLNQDAYKHKQISSDSLGVSELGSLLKLATAIGYKVIKPRIESIGTLQGEPLESIDVKDITNFNEVIRVLIGPSTGDGEEIFDIYISSPKWVEDQCGNRGYWLARRTLMLSRWDVRAIRHAVQESVLKITGESWQAISQQLASFMMWEFQDYKDIST